jgi:hypothetical protein
MGCLNMSDSLSANVVLAEYAALRAEIMHRINAVHTLYTLQLTSSFSLIAFSLSSLGRAEFLLVVPEITYLLFGRYCDERAWIFRTSKYIREELSPQVPRGFAWEAWVMDNRSRIDIPGWRHADALPFPGIAIIVLIFAAPWTTTSRESSGTWLLSALWLLGIVFAALTTHAYWFTRREMSNRLQ